MLGYNIGDGYLEHEGCNMAAKSKREWTPEEDRALLDAYVQAEKKTIVVDEWAQKLKVKPSTIQSRVQTLRQKENLTARRDFAWAKKLGLDDLLELRAYVDTLIDRKKKDEIAALESKLAELKASRE